MLIKTIHYKNFAGDMVSRKLYFHLTTAKAIRMRIAEMIFDMDEIEKGKDNPEAIDSAKFKDGFAKRLQAIRERGNGKEILDFFDDMVEASYGVISEDGETFAQSEEEYQKWTKTASYDYFFTRLVTDTEWMTEFVNEVLPTDFDIPGEKK